MKKIVLFIMIVLFTFAHARVVDAIAMVVEGEPVTTAEIRAIRTQMGVSKKKAIDILIQDRLQKSAMRDIVIDEALIDGKVKEIASQNNISVAKMQKVLKSQGTSWSKYRGSIRESMKKEKFFKNNILRSIPTPTEDELKLYYKQHRKEFFIPKSISLIEYSTPTMKEMKKFLSTKKTKGIKSKWMKKQSKNLDPTMLQSLLQTQNNSFTQPFNAGDRIITYKVLSKNGKSPMPFDVARPAITNKWKRAQQGKILKDYFEKLKTNADVQYLR